MFTTRASAMTLPVRRKSIFEGRLVEVKLEFRTSVAEGVLWFSESQYGSIKLFFESEKRLPFVLFFILTVSINL